MISRASFVVAIAVATAASALAITRADTAAAAENVLICASGSATQEFSPPVDSTPATIALTVASHYGSCVSTSQPKISFGGDSSGYTVPGLDCDTLFNPGTTTETIKWNTGQTSTYSGSYSVVLVEGDAVATTKGTVTSGLFDGDQVIRTVTYIAGILSDNCLEGGLSASSGPAQLVITGT